MTLPNERFIAFDIRIESRKPDAPLSAPAMIRTLLPIANPVAAAARPAYELSSETTTGMSAPPIGSTISTPSSRASPIITQNASGFAGLDDQPHEQPHRGRQQHRC